MDDSELFILSLISEYLSKNEYYINTSYSTAITGQNIENVVQNQILKSDLFIGIASYTGINSQWLVNEWQTAQTNGKTAVFLIEDNVTINPAFLKENFVIRFNRQSPQESLRHLQEMIDKQKNENSNKALNWIVGGLLGIAIIKLLSDE
jgi:hypothetical protein